MKMVVKIQKEYEDLKEMAKELEDLEKNKWILVGIKPLQ